MLASQYKLVASLNSTVTVMVTSLNGGLSARRPTLRGGSVLINVLVKLPVQYLLNAVLYSELIFILSFFTRSWTLIDRLRGRDTSY